LYWCEAGELQHPPIALGFAADRKIATSVNASGTLRGMLRGALRATGSDGRRNGQT
jgi:hypothetical protein